MSEDIRPFRIAVTDDWQGVARSSADWAPLPEPAVPLINHPYGVIVTGIGGTGVASLTSSLVSYILNESSTVRRM